MSPSIESSVLELKSGLKLEFKDDETVKSFKSFYNRIKSTNRN